MESKQYIGNNKRIVIDDNRMDFRIIGNNNKIEIKQNSSSIHIIGNSSRVKIGKNNGKIKYIGNDGRIYLSFGCDKGSVSFIGSNVIVKIMSIDDMWTENK